LDDTSPVALSVNTTVACFLPPKAEVFALERLSE
jgi:hypothetical protein